MLASQTTARLGRAAVRQLHTSTRCFAESAAASTSASASSLDDANVSKVVKTAPKLPRFAVEVGEAIQNRLDTYYTRSLERDLLYMTYDHGLDMTSRDVAMRRTLRVQRQWDPTSPYTKNRPAPPNRGGRALAPNAVNYMNNVVAIDRIVLSTFSSESITNRHALISLLAIVRAITGKPVLESQADEHVYTAARSQHKMPAKGYVRIIRSKTNVASWKLRRDAPCGVKAVLPQKAAYSFLEQLVTFVMPRIREFNGVPLPAATEPQNHGAAVQGTVSFGFEKDAYSFFPQTEINWDSYSSKPPGLYVDVITNQRGEGSSAKARQLLSGLGVPFVPRGEA